MSTPKLLRPANFSRSGRNSFSSLCIRGAMTLGQSCAHDVKEELWAQHIRKDAGMGPGEWKAALVGRPSLFDGEGIDLVWSTDVSVSTVLSEPAELYGVQFNCFVLEQGEWGN